MWVLYLIGLIVQGIIWGVATNKVIENKGYSENWFWWGFFFGFLALIVACTKPQAQYYNSSSSSSSLFAASAEEKMKIQQQALLEQGGWKCNKCGNVNPSYTGTCNCGNLKASNQTKEKEDKRETANFQEMKSYKDLLDSGVITQEEFDAKKEQLLGLSGIMKTAEADEPLLKRVFIFLEDGNWSEADSYCEKVLDQDPENALAYLGKLMAELHVSQLEDLLNCDRLFNDSNNYKKAVRFGEGKIAGILSGYIDFFIERNEKMRLTDIYNNAVTAMNAAKTESAYKAVAKTFKTIPEFQDADTLAEQCLERAEDCHKDEIYASARKQMTGNDVSKFEAAIKTFSAISGWKDVDEQILACQRKIEEIKAKEEADRHEWLRQAKEKRIAEEKAAKKRKIIIAIVSSIVIVSIVFIFVLTKVIIPNSKYNSAVALYDAGKYQEAITAFTALNGYKDSTDKIVECKYNSAVALYDSGKYDEAITAFTAMNGYKDSTDKIVECKYNSAMELYNSQQYDKAFNIFYSLNYKDSADKAEECVFHKIIAELKTKRVGDILQLGSYSWKILDIKDNKMLIISTVAVANMPYNESAMSDLTWEKCTLRAWLNETFYQSFSPGAQKLIVTTIITPDSDPKWGVYPGNNTEDKVFLLSTSEFKRYFSEGEKAKCLYNGSDCAWWLRNTGLFLNTGIYYYSEYATSITDDGYLMPVNKPNLNYYDHVKRGRKYYCVRPAMWISIET